MYRAIAIVANASNNKPVTTRDTIDIRDCSAFIAAT